MWKLFWISGRRRGDFSSAIPSRPALELAPTQALLGIFPDGYSGRDVKLNTRLYKVPILRTSGAILVGPHIPSWSVRGQIYIFHCNVVCPSVLRSSNWSSPLSFRSEFL